MLASATEICMGPPGLAAPQDVVGGAQVSEGHPEGSAVLEPVEAGRDVIRAGRVEFDVADGRGAAAAGVLIRVQDVGAVGAVYAANGGVLQRQGLVGAAALDLDLVTVVLGQSGPVPVGIVDRFYPVGDGAACADGPVGGGIAGD